MAELDVVQKEPRIGCIAGTKKRPHPHSVDVAKYSPIVVIVAIHLIPFLSLIPYIKPMLHMAVPFFSFSTIPILAELFAVSFLSSSVFNLELYIDNIEH